MKPTTLFAAALIVFTSFGIGSGTQPATARTIGQFIDDATIVATVKAKLAADKFSNLTKIGVKSAQGSSRSAVPSIRPTGAAGLCRLPALSMASGPSSTTST